MRMKQSALGLIGLAAMLGQFPAMGAKTSENSTEHRDLQKPSGERLVPQKYKTRTFSSLHDRSHLAGVFKNQRQYRKMVAQNPHLRKSKKHRSKN